MRKSLFVLSLAVAGILSAAGCPEEEEAEATVEAAPTKAEIPPYAPTGEHAEVMKAAAQGITADNAVEKAKGLEAQLDEALKPKGGAEVAKDEAAKDEGDGT